MATAIPDRFKLEMRLGRDDDVEEWLATDTSLDRPVLVRSLGPESSEERRTGFVTAVSAAAKATHPHLARVFAVEKVDGGAYSVSEWTGGSTAKDRYESGQTIDLPDFLPNAAGLAGALAELHDRGVAHGSIDLGAISYSVAHAAKLGGFGRENQAGQSEDVKALAVTLESALTGQPTGGPPPSETIDGFPRSIDRILRTAQAGDLDAHELEKALLAAPTPRRPTPEPSAASRRLLFAAVVLTLIAVALVGIGRVFSGGDQPLLPPPPTTLANVTETTSPQTETTIGPPTGDVIVENVTSFDPFGEGGENDQDLPNLLDGDITTFWRTERYEAPLSSTKPGVGVALAVSGRPDRVELLGLTLGTSFEVYWSESFFGEISRWSRVAGGKAPPGGAFIDLPARVNGFWLVWLTDLPERTDGSFSSGMSEVRFQS